MFQALVSVIITLLIILLLIFPSITHFYSVGAQEEFADTEFEEEGKPKLFDTNLKISTIVEGLSTPTSMAFVGPGDILVLEKDTGMVKRIVDGKVLAKPVLDINVANSIERCLCGIAASRDRSTTYVFLYYTEIDGKDGDEDRKSTRLNSSHGYISYAVFCLKKKTKLTTNDVNGTLTTN